MSKASKIEGLADTLEAFTTELAALKLPAMQESILETIKAYEADPEGNHLALNPSILLWLLTVDGKTGLNFSDAARDAVMAAYERVNDRQSSRR